jgi:hypothetical protein
MGDVLTASPSPLIMLLAESDKSQVSGDRVPGKAMTIVLPAGS